MIPADGIDGIKKFVLETVEKAGGKPCPPILVGVGIGGQFRKGGNACERSNNLKGS